MGLAAIIFDKDGTLFDFDRTWAPWAEDLIQELSRGDAVLLARLAGIIGLDRAAGVFVRDSKFIAETIQQQAEALVEALPDWTAGELSAKMRTQAVEVTLVEGVASKPILLRLRDLGLKLAVVTNDAQAAAHRHLDAVEIRDLFDFVAGYDSGFGSKPDPDPLLAAARALGVAPSHCAMVGDSTHDIFAAQKAGMTSIGVLSGPATRAQLEAHADVVFDDISALPNYVAQRRRTSMSKETPR